MEDLPDVLQDRLHEPHRGPMVAGHRRAIRGVVDGDDCLGATISGSGPTMLLWCRREFSDRVADAAKEALHRRPRARHGAAVPAHAGRGARPLDGRCRPAPRARGGVSAGLRWHHARGVLDCSPRAASSASSTPTPTRSPTRAPTRAPSAAIAHGRRLAAEGADVVEVGGESLRFSEHTPVEVEIGRVVPVIEALAAELDVPVAVDTFKPEVARAGDRRGRGDPQRPHRPARAGDGARSPPRAGSASC